MTKKQDRVLSATQDLARGEETAGELPVAKVRRSIRDRLEAAREKIQDAGLEVKPVSTGYAGLSPRVQNGYSQDLRDMVVEDVTDFVRDRPFTSLLIAGTSGLLLAMLARSSGMLPGSSRARDIGNFQEMKLRLLSMIAKVDEAINVVDTSLLKLAAQQREIDAIKEEMNLV